MQNLDDANKKEVSKDNVDMNRRKALAKLGMMAVAAYAAPLMLKVSDAHAKGSGGSGGSGSDSGGDSGGDASGSSSSDAGGATGATSPSSAGGADSASGATGATGASGSDSSEFINPDGIEGGIEGGV